MSSNSEGLAKRARDPKESVRESEGNDKYSKVPGAMDRMKGSGRGIRSLAAAIAVPLLASSIVSLRNPPDDWYSALSKPSWTPPNWIFALVWSLLYPAAGLASWLVWAKGGWQRNSHALTVYLLLLGLSLLRAPLFFGLHNPSLALLNTSALVVASLMCMLTFKPVNHVAAHLMKPYLVWMIVEAAVLMGILMHSWNAESGVVKVED